MRLIDSRITPVSSDYPTCSECYVQLAIYPGDISINVVSDLLGLKATEINVAGARSVNSLGREKVVKISSWFLSSKDSVSSKDLREHIDWLLCRLSVVSNELISLQNKDSVKMTFLCVWRSKLGHSGPVLWPEQMRALAALNLECSFDIYFDDE